MNTLQQIHEKISGDHETRKRALKILQSWSFGHEINDTDLDALDETQLEYVALKHFNTLAENVNAGLHVKEMDLLQ